MLAYSQQSEAHSNNERGGERQVQPWAKSRLPNNNKKHLCVIDQAVRGRWRARRGQIDRNPLWSLPFFTKTVCGVTGDTAGRQMAQREDSIKTEKKRKGTKKKPKKKQRKKELDMDGLRDNGPPGTDMEKTPHPSCIRPRHSDWKRDKMTIKDAAGLFCFSV